MTVEFIKNKLYQVGGSVRDGFLGLKSKDIDFTVVTESFDSMREFIVNDLGGKIFVETPKFLTIRAITPEFGAADFVMARKDGEYFDGRHPEKVEPGTILDDLARRDFTMNAIAFDVRSKEFIDPFNGAYDIKIKMIRAVGDPNVRLTEDKLRAFRALRFAVTKDFRIDWKLQLAMVRLKIGDFDSTSTERIREELLRMFSKDTLKSLTLLAEFDNLRSVAFQRGIWLKPTTEER